MTPALRAILLAGNRPSLDLNFPSGVDSRITFSGGAGGTVVNSSGVIATASAPRIDYDPVSLACKGLLVEEQRTNVLLNSLINGTNLSTQSYTTSAQAYTLSFYGTGTITLSGAYTGSLVGSGAYPTRSTLTFTSTAASLTLTVTGTVQYAQLEAGSFATSFIPTAGATVTRTADAASMTGGNFSWFNTSAGSFVVEFNMVAPSGSPTRGVISSGDNARYVYVASSPDGASSYDTVTGITTAGSMSDGAVHKVASAYTAGLTRSLVADGGAVVTASSCAAVYTSGTSFLIGSLAASPLNGHIRRIRYWPRRLSDASLQTLTQ